MFDAIEEGTFSLKALDDADGIHPVLTGVEVRGRVQGALFAMTLRQTYCNTSARTLEVIYTFPLPSRAVLLGMSAQLGDRRLDCEVLPRRRAEAVYEDALAEGDAPVLLEAAGDGLHTASIGNLKPAEVMTLEVRMAQPLTFEHGRLRLAVPMTIAPRFGLATNAGVAAHAEPVTSLRAQYPLSLTVDVVGALGDGDIECPTHAAVFTRTAEGLRLTLAPTARMDRDVVLWVTLPSDRVDGNTTEEDETQAGLPAAASARSDPGVLTLAADSVTGSTVALAAFALPADTARHAVNLKLLVDCSRSMGGDSIHSVCEALAGVAGALEEGDTVSLTRFGSDPEVEMPPCPCTDANLRVLSRAVGATDATLGGTELDFALQRVMLLGEQADILLITDGEVWGIDEEIRLARASRHRIFIIGVGTSPAEGLLRRVAESTGGACECATPGEALEAAAMRMLQRMRQPYLQGLKVDWGLPDGATPAWELPLPAGVFGGDTVLAWAGLDGEQASAQAPGAERPALPAPRARLLMQRGKGLWGVLAETGDVAVASSGDLLQDLPRVAAQRRLDWWLSGVDLDDADQTCATKKGKSGAGKKSGPRPEGAQLGATPPNLDQIDQAERIEHARALALAYRLVSPLTHAVLVHRRDDANKPADEAALHQVEQMLPAGWGGTGSVRASEMVYRSTHASPAAASSCTSMASPSLWRPARTTLGGGVMAACVPPAATTWHDDRWRSANVEIDQPTAETQVDTVSWLNRAAGGDLAVTPMPSGTGRSTGVSPPFKSTAAAAPRRPHTLAEIAHPIDDHLRSGGSVESLSTLAQTFRYDTRLVDAMSDLLDLEPAEGIAWLWLAQWVAERHAASGSVPEAQPLQVRIDAFKIDTPVLAEVKAALDRHLGRVDPTAWRAPRADRLAKVFETLYVLGRHAVPAIPQVFSDKPPEQ
jgi:Ca-activated chloride channel family protein